MQGISKVKVKNTKSSREFSENTRPLINHAEENSIYSLKIANYGSNSAIFKQTIVNHLMSVTAPGYLIWKGRSGAIGKFGGLLATLKCDCHVLMLK